MPTIGQIAFLYSAVGVSIDNLGELVFVRRAVGLRLFAWMLFRVFVVCVPAFAAVDFLLNFLSRCRSEDDRD